MFARTFFQFAMFVVVCCLAVPASLSAATIGHWRFEDTPGFLLDSSGNGNTLSLNGTVTQTTLPGTGPGSAFPNPVPNTLQSNAKAADIAGTSDSLVRSNLSVLPTTQFTIESFVNWTNSANSNEANADGIFAFTDGISDLGFFFQIRTDGIFSSDPNGELFITLNDGTGNTPIPSGFIPTQGIDYYMAATFDMSGTLNFYAKDLTNNTPLETYIINHSLTGTLNSAANDIEIGGLYNGLNNFDFDGLIDEVRFSNVALGVSDLLISAQSVDAAPVPEPSSFWLLGLGILALRRRSRKN